MRIVISQDELRQIVSDHLMAKFQSDYAFECTDSPSYSGWSWEEMTPDFLAAKAENERQMEAYRVKWAEEYKIKQEAEAAAKFAIDNAVTGNKS